VDRRWRKPQGSTRFVVNRDGYINHLYELSVADRAIRVRRNKRETEHVAVILRALSVEIAEQGDPGQRAGQRRRHGIRVGVVDRRAGAARSDSLAVASTAFGRASDSHLRQRRRHVIVGSFNYIRAIRQRKRRAHH
jgi:hypothetical protein